MKRYKLTKQDMTTHGGFKWEIGKAYTTHGEGELCSDGWLHFYSSPLLAILLNPIHADIENPRLFLAECGGKTKNDHGLKIGHTEARLIEELPTPIITKTQRVAFSILCAQKIYREPVWAAWAAAWLAGKREARAGEAAEAAAEAAARAAERAAEAAAWAAARAAARAGSQEIDFGKLADQAVKMIFGK